MRLKRFTAKDMRSALTLIKEELGPDAVIMSNKRVDGGVEIVAGIEDDSPAKNTSAAFSKKPQQGTNPSVPGGNLTNNSTFERDLGDDEVSLSAAGSAGAKNLSAAPGSGSSGHGGAAFAQSLLDILKRQQAVQEQLQAGTNPAAASSAAENNASSSVSASPAAASATSSSVRRRDTPPRTLGEDSDLAALMERDEKRRQAQSAVMREHGIESFAAPDNKGAGAGTAAASAQGGAALQQLSDEMAQLRRLLQFELAGLMSEQKSRLEPVKAMVSQLLQSAGFDGALSDEFAGAVSPDASFNFAWRELAKILALRIPTGADEIITEGGIVALIGPAGVGKTTTLAKLAARFVMRYGPERVALVTADHFRIGAVEQVKTYGRIMGCASFAVKSLNELPELLYTLRDKSLVLVDTAGVGFKDERFGTQLAQLKLQTKLKLKHYLVLPATAQKRVLEKAYEQFKPLGLTGLILTKLDECGSLGDALSLVIGSSIKLCYITTGQRVPEDLAVPSAQSMALKALACVEDDAVQSALQH